MRALLQRVSYASVTVNNIRISEIQKGYLILLGVSQTDTLDDAKILAAKIAKLRIFADENDKMNLSIQDVCGSILLVSQFTLCANSRHGNRPSFVSAMPPQPAKDIYQHFGTLLEEQNIPVQYGEFGAMMDVTLTNDGPVTILLESLNGVIL